MNKRVKIDVVDPVAGLASRWALRSAKPANVEQTKPAETSEETGTGKETGTTEQTGTEQTGTQQETTEPTETQKTTEEGGGICGPAALVGLAVVPLLLRRRK